MRLTAADLVDQLVDAFAGRLVVLGEHANLLAVVAFRDVLEDVVEVVKLEEGTDGTELLFPKIAVSRTTGNKMAKNIMLPSTVPPRPLIIEAPFWTASSM